MDEDAPDERSENEASDRHQTGGEGTASGTGPADGDTESTDGEDVPEDPPVADPSPRHSSVDERVQSDEVGTGSDPEESSQSRAVADAVETTGGTEAQQDGASDGEQFGTDSELPVDVRKYDRFQKIEGGTYDRANEFLRDRTYITAREWAISRLCADFRTETGVEMTKIGEHLPELVPFMTDTYSPQAVNQARASFEEKVRMAGATFLYGALSDFFTADELDEVMYEATEVAKFLLEVEGVELSVEEELEAEDRISGVMREVREHSMALRHDEVECPECGHSFRVDGEE